MFKRIVDKHAYMYTPKAFIFIAILFHVYSRTQVIIFSTKYWQDSLKRANLTLEAEKRELSDLVDKKNKEIDRVQGV